MATTDNIISLRQPKPLTAAERAKAYRDRKRQKATEIAPPQKPSVGSTVTPVTNVTPVTGGGSKTTHPVRVTAHLAPALLTVASFALAAVGITINGWFARSLGSSDIAGWLFLAIGVAADLVALAIPSCAAGLWATHQRGAALAGWSVWLATFLFALTAGIGFASVNIADVTASRAGRVTPVIEQARASLADAMATRDRECASGIGKTCRLREDTVTERRANLDAAMSATEHSADPQTDAIRRMVAWVSFGTLRPSGEDFAMLRLMLLALLPQVGGILLMIARRT